MRNFYSTLSLITIIIFVFANNINAQRTCGAHDHMLEQLEANPKMKSNQENLEKFTKSYVRNFSALKTSQTRTIPVYVHIIYKTSQENISDAQVESQITVLNKDYGGTNPDLSNVPSFFSSVTSQGTGIQFELVSISRKYVNKTSWGTDDAMKKSSQGGVDPITPNTHMNMWICNIGGGILGYAQFPGGSASTDGVVFSPQYCGSKDYNDGSFYLSSPFDEGRTCTHEVGHYLNLRHIWGDGDCSASDYVGDTPSAEAANYSCPSHPKVSCSSNDMFMNYMDYVDDACMVMFSEGQEARMWACLNSSRSDLGTSGTTADTEAPSTPSNLASSSITGTSVNLTWNASTDNTDVTAYNIYEGGSLLASTSSTSYTITGLSASTSYSFYVKAKDEAGNISNASNTINVTTDAGSTTNCYASNVTLSLTFDNYPAETSWSLKNGAGTTVASGSDYGTSHKNTTISEVFDITEGDYTFTINDSYGDGICCSYGNGSYTLTDNDNTQIATGGAIGSSETTNFCISGTTITEPTAHCSEATNISASASQWKYYTIDVPAGATNLKIDISGGTGDADLHTRFGSQPTTSSYDCRPYKTGNTETCNVDAPQTGTYHIGIRAYSAFSGVKLNICYDAVARFSAKSSGLLYSSSKFDEGNFNIYPNPTSDVLYLNLHYGVVKTAEIYDISGSAIKTINLEETKEINVENLAPGIYMIKFNIDGKINSQRFIKK